MKENRALEQEADRVAERVMRMPESHGSLSISSGAHPGVQRKCACGGSAGVSGTCSECSRKKLLGQPYQTRLRINEPGDAYEQEADRVAARVIEMSERDSVSGVSIDEEMANLLLFQKAFQASAKLISMTDEMLNTIIQM